MYCYGIIYYFGHDHLITVQIIVYLNTLLVLAYCSNMEKLWCHAFAVGIIKS